MKAFRSFEQSDPAHCPAGLHFVTVKSSALGHRADITLFVPSEAEGLVGLPLAILMHGVYGSHWAWAFKGGVHQTLANLIRSGDVAPMILCMPSDGLWGDGSGYVPHATQNFERWIVEEVPAVAQRACGAVNDRSPLLIAGLSMGGFGALRLAAKYPQRFSAASAHSTITELSQLDRLIIEPVNDWSAAPEDQDVLSAFMRSPGPFPELRFDCGTEDSLLAANRSLHAAFEREGIRHVYEEFAGAHDWRYWARHVERTITFFDGTLRSGPVPRQDL